MSLGPITLYDDALVGGGSLWLRTAAGHVAVELDRWRRPADEVDSAVVRRCRGPVLDVGCGPGRMVAALGARGVPALGVDVAAAAVRLALRSGALALCRDVFGRVPGEGRWGEVLLLDGNIGIGGDVPGLLRRVRTLLAEDGRLLAEVDPAEVDEVVAARVEDGFGRVSVPFRWARVGMSALRRRAAAEGYEVFDAWCEGGRHFVTLQSTGQRTGPGPRPSSGRLTKTPGGSGGFA